MNNLKFGLFSSLSDKEKKLIKKGPQPDSIDPMLATLSHRRFSDENWLFERKLDGERCISFRTGNALHLMSRNNKKLNNTYPEIVTALAKEEISDFITDGEILAFDKNLTSFARLQNRMHISDPEKALDSDVKVYYYIFDLLYVNGYNIERLPLRKRKNLLRQAFKWEDPIRFVQHKNEDGEEYFQSACEKGWEGLIAKNAESRYIKGRSKQWLKFKCINQQEFVIGGFTEPEGARIGFGALLIGYYEEDELIYAGKVGTGFDDKMLKNLSERLKDNIEKSSPFKDNNDPQIKNVQWVKPELVAEIGFTEWTEDGKLRHPRFLGLRRDKRPQDVKREAPE